MYQIGTLLFMHCANMALKGVVNMYKENFHTKIKKARENAGYTQQQTADITGISRVTISRIETGTREPSLEDMGTLIDFYEVSADWVLGTGIKKSK